MDLNAIRAERAKWMEWKNIAPLRDALNALPEVDTVFSPGNTVALQSGEAVDLSELERCARMMMPWRKGPFDLFGLFIDTEWRSDLKYNFLRPHFNLQGKKVADIGCNNGYYMFRFLEDSPAKVVGFDPSALFRTQFDLIEHFAKTGIVYELLGVEHLPYYEEKFDVIFCLGVLYHRSDPVAMLKALARGLEEGGEVYLDTFIIDGDEPVALCPSGSYSKISNVYFVPTLGALENWCIRAGFKKFEVLGTVVTTSDEQRKTDWIESQSLEDFLDPADSSKTVEGYPAPKRGYVRIKKGVKLAKEPSETQNEAGVQTAIKPQILLSTHEKINTAYSGYIVKLESGYAQVALETTDMMRADDVGLVHGGFIFSAADFAAMASVNEPNVVLASCNCLFLAPVRVGDVVVFEATEHQKEGRKRNITVRGFVMDIKVFEGEFKTVVTERHVLRLDLMKNVETGSAV